MSNPNPSFDPENTLPEDIVDDEVEDTSKYAVPPTNLEEEVLEETKEDQTYE